MNAASQVAELQRELAALKGAQTLPSLGNVASQTITWTPRTDAPQFFRATFSSAINASAQIAIYSSQFLWTNLGGGPMAGAMAVREISETTISWAIRTESTDGAPITMTVSVFSDFPGSLALSWI